MLGSWAKPIGEYGIICFKYAMQALGVSMCAALYAIITLHLYAYFKVMTKLLYLRLGTELGLVWIAVGLTLAYNIVYNHFFAMMIKPGSPTDLIEIEILRAEMKQRSHRKEVDEEDDQFDGLSSEVKKLVRYRSKTV